MGQALKRLVAVITTVLFGASFCVSAAAATGLGEKTRQFYVVVAHPDDETNGWSYLEQLPSDTYLVFVQITRGEGTDSCLTPEDAQNLSATDALAPTNLGTFARNLAGAETGTAEISSGPYKYEGPGSPVGEPDKGERHPLGNPWVGQRTDACGDARIASWHWFLDSQFRVDGIGTDLGIVNDPELDDDYKGRFCPSGYQGQGEGQSLEKQNGCAQVWANELGARVVFNLGDQGYVDGEFLPTRFTEQQVVAALETTRSNRAEWGLPELQETGVLVPNPYGDGQSCKRRFGGSDHLVINRAIRYADIDLPLRAGLMFCNSDAIADGASVREIIQKPTSAVGWNLINPVTGQRLGGAVVNYGWVIEDYGFPGCLDCFYWEVTS